MDVYVITVFRVTDVDPDSPPEVFVGRDYAAAVSKAKKGLSEFPHCTVEDDDEEEAKVDKAWNLAQLEKCTLVGELNQWLNIVLDGDYALAGTSASL